MPPNNGDSGSSYMELGTSMQVIKHSQLVSQGAPEKGTVKMNPPGIRATSNHPSRSISAKGLRFN